MALSPLQRAKMAGPNDQQILSSGTIVVAGLQLIVELVTGYISGILEGCNVKPLPRPELVSGQRNSSIRLGTKQQAIMPQTADLTTVRHFGYHFVGLATSLQFGGRYPDTSA